MNFFVATRPETVVSVVTRGKLPDRLPSYCEKTLKLSTTIAASLPKSCNIHQTFVVMGQGASLKSKAISRLFVASERAHRLVLRLFGGKCSKPIHVMPELFPKEERRQIPMEVPPPKRIKLTKEVKPIPGLRRLVDEEAHFKWLKEAIGMANEQILITSYGVRDDSLSEAHLWDLLKNAHDFGVKIYIYYNDKSWADPKAWKFLKRHTTIFEQAWTHSKIVAIDEEILAIGSFNWLSASSDEWDGYESSDATLVYQGKHCAELIEKVWRHLKRYRSYQHGTDLSKQWFYKSGRHRRPFTHLIKMGHTLSYLPSLETHRLYFRGLFRRARRRVIICCPFISGHFVSDVDKQAIKDAIKRNVQIVFLIRPSYLEFLLKKNFPGADLIQVSDLHQKTIIVDDDEIAEGSFNWLSAVRTKDHEHHNHETTLVLGGERAAAYIKQLCERWFFTAAGPKTVVSVVTKGKLPSKFKSQLTLSTNFGSALPSLQPDEYAVHETFIIAVQGVSVTPETISDLSVASKRGRNYLLKLFGGNCPKPIEVNPEAFFLNEDQVEPVVQPAPPKIKEKEREPIQSTKKLLPDPNSFRPTSIDLTASPKERSQDMRGSTPEPISSLIRLVDERAHLKWLKRVIKSAKETVLITSFSLDEEALERAGLYDSLKAATKRGVKIYIYCNPKYWIEPAVFDFLRKYTTLFAKTSTHSKIVAVDSKTVAIGSCNWLGDFGEEWDDSFNATFVYNGEKCKSLIDEIWHHLKHYRTLDFGNSRSKKVYYEKKDHLKDLKFKLTEGLTLVYLQSLEKHRGYFQGVFSRARHRIIIAAPFVSEHCLRDIHRSSVADAVKRGVKISILHQPSYKQSLLKVMFPTARLIEHEDVHQKTLIVDNCEIAEGSFNWLSAVRNKDSKYHYHEATLVLQGRGAAPYIEQFFSSLMGQAVKEIWMQSDRK